MNIYKNFLPKKKFNHIKNYILSDLMPWYYNDEIVNKGDGFYQFTYSFIREGNQNCHDDMIKLLSHKAGVVQW